MGLCEACAMAPWNTGLVEFRTFGVNVGRFSGRGGPGRAASGGGPGHTREPLARRAARRTPKPPARHNGARVLSFVR